MATEKVSTAEDSEYENGVADVLAFLTPHATVERNLKLPGALTETPRQLDVVVRGEMFGRDHALLIVDAKRWKSKTPDVREVGTFIDMVRDVRADFGLIVSLRRATRAARIRARNEQSIGVRVMTLEELARWSPPGTFVITLRISSDDHAVAVRSLRRAGFRVTEGSGHPFEQGQELLSLARHTGALAPDGTVQTELVQLAHETLGAKGVAFGHVAHGLVAEGGTPGARWIPLRIGDTELPRVLAASIDELDEKIRGVARACGVESGLVIAEPPEGWPFERGFSFDALDGLLFEPETNR